MNKLLLCVLLFFPLFLSAKEKELVLEYDLNNDGIIGLGLNNKGAKDLLIKDLVLSVQKAFSLESDPFSHGMIWHRLRPKNAGFGKSYFSFHLKNREGVKVTIPNEIWLTVAEYNVKKELIGKWVRTKIALKRKVTLHDNK